MPKYVTNVIRMQGITDLPLFAENDGQKCFDFNKLIPMPESLNIEAGSMTGESIIYFLTEKCTIPLACLDKEKQDIIAQTVSNLFAGNSWPQAVFNRAMAGANKYKSLEETMYTAGKIYVQNYLKYGHTTWYDWCAENWSTRWNAYPNKILDKDTIQFGTEWSRPEAILKKLANMYPSERIDHWWADEDTGCNAGYVIYENGKEHGGPAIDGSHDAYEIYVFCHGESDCLEKVNGIWTRCNCDTCNRC